MQSATHSGRRCWAVIAPVDMTCSQFPQVRCYSLPSHTSNMLLLCTFLSPININFFLGLLQCFAVLHQLLACWLTNGATSVYGQKHQEYRLTHSSPKYSICLCIHAWRSWLRNYASSRKVACSTPDGVIRIFIYIILPVALDPGVDSASNRDEYQEYFLKGKDGWCVRLTTIFLCWLSRTSGSRSFLDCFTFTFTCASTLNVFSPYCYLRACCRIVAFTDWHLRLSLASKWPLLEAI
jgi:hypothetical protein